VKYQSSQPPDLFLHDQEPFFLVRAQDVLAVPAITQYAVLARQIGEHDLARQVLAAAVEVAEWQRDHAELVGVPD
jgi:hypothetical protein